MWSIKWIVGNMYPIKILSTLQLNKYTRCIQNAKIILKNKKINQVTNKDMLHQVKQCFHTILKNIFFSSYNFFVLIPNFQPHVQTQQ